MNNSQNNLNNINFKSNRLDNPLEYSTNRNSILTEDKLIRKINSINFMVEKIIENNENFENLVENSEFNNKQKIKKILSENKV